MGMIYKNGYPLAAGEPGKPAYESAYEAGYAGTVAEFTDSLNADTATTLTATIGISWIGTTAPFIQEIAVIPVNGVTIAADDNPIIYLNTDGFSQVPKELESAFSMITRILTIDGGIVVECHSKKPAISIPIKIKVVR